MIKANNMIRSELIAKLTFNREHPKKLARAIFFFSFIVFGKMFVQLIGLTRLINNGQKRRSSVKKWAGLDGKCLRPIKRSKRSENNQRSIVGDVHVVTSRSLDNHSYANERKRNGDIQLRSRVSCCLFFPCLNKQESVQLRLRTIQD